MDGVNRWSGLTEWVSEHKAEQMLTLQLQVTSQYAARLFPVNGTLRLFARFKRIAN